MTVRKNEKQKTFEQQALVHSEMLYRFGMHLAGNTADARDLVQETYLKAYRFWDHYDQGTNLRAWLCRILKNSFVNLYWRESKELTLLDRDDALAETSMPFVASEVSDPQEVVFNHLLDDNVSKAILVLRQEYRTAVILSDIEGWTYEEIAGFTGCPLGTVRSRIHRGRKLLHSMLHGYAKSRGYVKSSQDRAESMPYVAAG